MSFSTQLMQYGQRRAARKLLRAAPWIGGLVALATLGAAVRRKGAVGGTVDTMLDFIPFVGAVKNVAEAVRGRDFIADRQRRLSA
jgi:Pre-toxin TG